MKKLISILLLLTLALAMLPLSVAATVAGEEAWGTCGDEVAWSLDGNTLTISGTGPMYDFEDEAPWHEYKDMIEKVVFTGGVTTVGWRSFKDYDSITSVDFGDSMHTIGAYAFRDCDGLVRIHLPASFRVFGEECFCHCDKLKAIHCEGGAFPSFKGSCLWNTECKIYYPASDPWPVSLIEQLETAFAHRIEFVDSDGVDHYVSGYDLESMPNDLDDHEESSAVSATPVETEPEPTETIEPELVIPKPTEPPLPQRETVPEKVPETVPETQPETQPETEPETTAPAVVWETVPPTTKPAAHQRTSGGKTGLILVAGVLVALGLGAVIYGVSTRNRRDSF